jgi:hypothetical protein
MMIPLKWLVIQGTDIPISCHPAGDYYRGLMGQGDPLDSYYVRKLYSDVLNGRSMYGFLSTSDVDTFLKNRESDFHRHSHGDLPEAVLRADGKYEIQDGHHRCVRAFVEGETNVDVAITRVDDSWLDLEKDLFSIYGSETLYQPIDHPYFSDWKIIRRDRNSVIEKYLLGSLAYGYLRPGQSALDLGCCTGGISRLLASTGLVTTGVDCDDRVLRISRHLSKTFNVPVEYENRDLLGDLSWMTEKSVSVMLSVAHHFLEKHNIGCLESMLQVIGSKSTLLILDCPCPGKDAWANSVVPLDQVEDFYRRCLPHHYVDTLGLVDGRKILGLWRAI